MRGLEVNTYSLVGRCGRTGELGACVASAVPAVGAVCLRFRPGVGIVSTQSWVNPYLADAALDAMAGGAEAPAALEAALAADDAAGFRQIGAIAAAGPGAAWTGEGCTAWAGQHPAESFAAQGNMLTGPEVIAAMAAAFAADPAAPLEERLMRALEAAQAAGGDRRGRQAAALMVTTAESYPRVDLRVDEHAAPIAELRRVLTVAAAQLAPFVAGMPQRGGPTTPAPDAVVEMLLRSPPDRPAGGGSRDP